MLSCLYGFALIPISSVILTFHLSMRKAIPLDPIYTLNKEIAAFDTGLTGVLSLVFIVKYFAVHFNVRYYIALASTELV